MDGPNPAGDWETWEKRKFASRKAKTGKKKNEVLGLNLSYDEIRRIYRLEKNTAKLVEVSEDFYNLLNEFVKEEKRRYLKSLKDFSLEQARDFANLKKMVEEIFLLRQRKILNLALLASKNDEQTKAFMSLPEQKMFASAVSLLESHRQLLADLFSPNGQASSDQTHAIDVDLVSVRVTREVPAFIGTDMKEYGPFSTNQRVELPFSVAKLFLDRKLAERTGEN